MSDSINQRIALYRKLANLTQTEAAEKLGMKCSTYSQMERKGSISADKLIALADIFGVTPETLLYDPPARGYLNFTPNESLGREQVRQPEPTITTDPSYFVVTHKEESIVKILRNLPRDDYEEIIGLINEKYQTSKKK